MKRRTVLLSTLFFMVIAAAYAIVPTLRTLSVTSMTLPSQPVDVPTPERASLSNPASGTTTLLAVTENENGDGLQARPVDPKTLADLLGYAPINFGHHYTYATSPDRKTLAVITWPSGSSNAEGALHLIDLDTWTDTLADLRINDYVGALAFGANGKTLYWTFPTAHDPAHGMPRNYQLHRYDLDSRQLSAIIQFPSSYMPWWLQTLRLSSANVAVFGIPTDRNNLTEDMPHVLIVDPAKNRIVVDVRLDGVKAGQFHEKATDETALAQGESWQYVMYSPGLAWDWERSVLYVVHVDEDKVTVVDLVKGAVIKQMLIRPQQSLLKWIAESLVPTAEAKGGPERGRRAVLSRDGKRLYVFSQKTADGLLRATNLRVIATDGMREISHIDDLLADFALTPDGKSLLVIKGEIVRPHGFDMMVSRDVYVLDAETLRERAHARANQVDYLGFDGFSPDDLYAYVKGTSARWVEGSGWRDWRTTWQLMDLNSYRLTSTGETRSSYAALLHIIQ